MRHNYSDPVSDIRATKDFLITNLLIQAKSEIEYVEFYLSHAKQPHWRKSTAKMAKHVESFIEIAKPNLVDDFIGMAENWFNRYSNSRAFNIVFKHIYIGRLMSPLPKNKVTERRKTWNYHYYLAIRFRKVRIKVKGHKFKQLAYVAAIGAMCPFGQVIHAEVIKDDKNDCLIIKNISDLMVIEKRFDRHEAYLGVEN